MKAVNGIVKVKVLLDRSSLEVFGNDGEKVISTMIYPDKDAKGLALFSEGEAVMKSLKMWDLSWGDMNVSGNCTFISLYTDTQAECLQCFR